VLQNEKAILDKVPSMIEDKFITQLKTVEDSSKLGQFIMFV